MKNKPLALFGGFLLLYILLTSYSTSGVKVPWFDETHYSSFGVGLIEFGYPCLSINGFTTPALFEIPYAAVQGLVYKMLGYEHLAHRLSGLVYILISGWILFFLTHKITKKKVVSILASSGFLLAHSTIWMANSGRPEPFNGLLFLLALLFLFLYAQNATKRYAFGFSFFLLLTCFTHPYFWANCLVLGILSLYIIRNKGLQTSHLLCAFGGVGAVLSLIFLLSPNILEGFDIYFSASKDFVTEEKGNPILGEFQNRLIYLIKFNPFNLLIILIGTTSFIKYYKKESYLLLAPLFTALFLLISVPKDTWYQIYAINVVLIPMTVIGCYEFITRLTIPKYKTLSFAMLGLFLLVGFLELAGTTYLRYDQRAWRDRTKVVNKITELTKTDTDLAVPYQLYFDFKEPHKNVFGITQSKRNKQKMPIPKYYQVLIDKGIKYFVLDKGKKLPKLEGYTFEKLGSVGQKPKRSKFNFLQDKPLYFDVYIITRTDN